MERPDPTISFQNMINPIKKGLTDLDRPNLCRQYKKGLYGS